MSAITELSIADAPEPGELAEQIDALVKKAAKTGIPADRVRPFARILVAAEIEVRLKKIRDEHTFRSSSEIIGAQYGLDGSNREQAERAYYNGRKAKHNIHASAEPALAKLIRLIQVVKKNHDALPLYIQENDFPQALNVALKSLNDLLDRTRIAGDYLERPDVATLYVKAQERRAKAVALDLGDVDLKTLPEQTKVALSKWFDEIQPGLSLNHNPHLPVDTQTYLWWRSLIANYPQKWTDMYALADKWKLSGAKDVEIFRRYVLKRTQGVTTILPCPTWATLKQ